jgi:hypothetical protein
LKNATDSTSKAVRAKIDVSGRNLTGQSRKVEMREIADGQGATYYIGELPVRNMETFDFTVAVLPDGHDTRFKLTFRQQFYTE